jgi:hypothetical protein
VRLNEKLELPPTLLTYYNRNNNIVLQFILLELIYACKDAEELEKLLHNPKLQLDSLFIHVSRLVGQTKKYIRIFSWSLNDGILTRVKNYCSLFVHNRNPADSRIMSLQTHSDRAWINGLESLDLIRLIKQMPSCNNECEKSLRIVLQKMLKRVHQLIRSIYQTLPMFCKDEHTLFFLLRHRTDLESLFGEKAILQLFTITFPKGLKTASRFIIQRYVKRGFTHLAPVISQKIAELEQHSSPYCIIKE